MTGTDQAPARDLLARNAKTGQTGGHFAAIDGDTMTTHSQMLKTRRKKQKIRKQLAREAKQAKKLKKQG
ncbi:hypothetical protein D3C83_58120 [compost metagenome]